MDFHLGVVWTPKKISLKIRSGDSNWQDPPHGGHGSLRRGHLCLFGVHSTLDGHGGLWKVVQSRFFGSGDKNITLIIRCCGHDGT